MDRMINFQSEDRVIGSASSPCWLQVAKDEKKVGILDAMTKHFMLLQENPNLESFNLERFKDWASKEVTYAGELFVLISGKTCRVVINNGSGTYKPVAGNGGDPLKNLKAVAEVFSETNPIYAVADPKVHFQVIENPTSFECLPK